MPRMRKRFGVPIRTLWKIHLLLGLPGVQIRRKIAGRQSARRKICRRNLRTLRRAHDRATRTLRHFSRMFQIPGMQGYQKNRKNDRHRVPGVQKRTTRRKEKQTRQTVLLLQSVSKMQNRLLEQAHRRNLPQMQLPPRLRPQRNNRMREQRMRLQKITIDKKSPKRSGIFKKQCLAKINLQNFFHSC